MTADAPRIQNSGEPWTDAEWSEELAPQFNNC